MKRRHFLTLSAALAAGPATGKSTHVQGREVGANSPDKAWQLAFAQVQTDYDPVTVPFRGQWPADLRGTLYRNGPGLMHRGATSLRHWFDGDGLIQSFEIRDARLTHQARSVRTTRFQAEAAANRYLWDGFGTAVAGALPTTRPDDLNPANIALLDTGDELLALWEAGSPYRIDSRTLQTLGRKVYSPETDGMPFTAHPRVEANGTLWSFGYMAGTGKIALYELTRNGELKRTALIEAPNADMVHDFAITDRFLVFVLMPLFAAASRPGQSLLERYRWDANQPTVVLLIDKNTLAIRYRAELASTSLFHLGNAWEDGDAVRIELMRSGDFKRLMSNMYASMAGQLNALMPTAEDGATDIVFDLKRSSARYETLLGRTCDFPAFDRRLTGKRSDHLHVLRRSPAMPASLFGFNELCRIDRKRQQVRSFDFGVSEIVEEHVFVAAPTGKAAEGWLVGTSYDWVRQRTLLNVFNAERPEDGPLARATLPRVMPLGLHGTFRSAKPLRS